LTEKATRNVIHPGQGLGRIGAAADHRVSVGYGVAEEGVGCCLKL